MRGRFSVARDLPSAGSPAEVHFVHLAGSSKFRRDGQLIVTGLPDPRDLGDLDQEDPGREAFETIIDNTRRYSLWCEGFWQN